MKLQGDGLSARSELTTVNGGRIPISRRLQRNNDIQSPLTPSSEVGS